jgi:hypothetical protein
MYDSLRDKIVCKLTGVVLNKKEDAVWKHMLGKKFEAKLGGFPRANPIGTFVRSG